MYSSNSYEYPTSSARDEPRPSFTESHNVSPALSAVHADLARPRASAAFPVKNLPEVVPGILSDGTLTIRHPTVSAYLDRLALAFENSLDGAGPSKTSTHGSLQLGRVDGVAETLGLELNVLQCECVLALAALRIYYDAKHPAHFALWGKSVRSRTEEVVRRICYHTPRLISSPICWMGARENLWLLNTQQLLTFPELSRNKAKQQPQRRMTLRQRKGRSAAMAPSTAPTAPANAAPLPASASIPPQNPKVKRVERLNEPIPQQERRAVTRWFRSRRHAQEDVDENGNANVDTMGEAQWQEPVHLMEVALVAAKVDAVSGDVEGIMKDTPEAKVKVVRDDPPTTAVAPREEPPSTSTAQATLPTRRSSRQVIKRRVAESVMAAMASGSGCTTPAGFPSRGSSTAVSETSDRTAVGKEPRGAKGRKRKVSDTDTEGAHVMEGKGVLEEGAPRKKAKRTPAQMTTAA